MKILQFGKFYPVMGGVEKVMYDLMTGLSEAGIRCDMLCASADNRPRDIEITPQSRVMAVKSVRKVKATMISPAMIMRLRRIKNEYDIIHIHHPDPMAALSLRLSGYKGKVVLHWHSDILKQRMLLQLFRPLQRWLIKRADAIVGTTPKYLKESPWLRGVQAKTVCVPIGIDEPGTVSEKATESIRNRWPGKKIVFSMGRLVDYKGFEYLINTAQYLPDDYVIVIGGTGPNRATLETRISASGLGEKVYLAGYISDEELPSFYEAADVFCLSSVERTEAFGVVQIESMSHGTPVVATEIPGSGVSWVNLHGVTGINVAPRDSKALADAILAVTSDKNTRERYGTAARARYEELFRKEKMISKMTEIYLNILNL